MRVRRTLGVLACLLALTGVAAVPARAEVAGADMAAKALGAHQELVQVSPVWEKGRVVGARLTVALVPGEYEHVRVGLRHTGSGAGLDKGARKTATKGSEGAELVHEFKMLPAAGDLHKRTFEIRYGRGNVLRGGEKVEVVTSWTKHGSDPKGKSRASSVVTLPGVASSDPTLCGAPVVPKGKRSAK